MKNRKIISITFLIFLGLLVISCKSTGDDKKENTPQKPDAQIAPPSGHADVLVLIENQNDEGKFYKVTAKVNEVMGYGPSTPVLPPGSDIEVFFRNQLSERDKSKIKNGEELSLRISYKQGMENSGNWFFVTFNN